MKTAILFGAFDRHNFGDLLFPHIAASLLGNTPLLFAGLVPRDLRDYGGHQVHALAQLARHWGKRPATLIHAGGEILTCDAWQAAVMLQSPAEAQAIIARLDGCPEQQRDWASRQIGIEALAPYCVPRKLFAPQVSLIYAGVGGVGLDRCDPALRTEVLAELKNADAVSVRDRQTLAHLAEAGITASLIPDPAIMVAELFGAPIRQPRPVLEQIREWFPGGYIAVQFSADFGDDATLAVIASELEETIRASGYGVVFFRAGSAPWHDDVDCFERVIARLPERSAALFPSLDLWDICALIAGCRAYCGSSLHGRIVAMAFARPRVNLVHPALGADKQAAFAATWDVGFPATVSPAGMAAGIGQILACDPEQLGDLATELALSYRAGFNALCSGTG
jgi:hypothetical protein